MAQLLAKMTPTMTTGCYFVLDGCEVFLGNETHTNLNWQTLFRLRTLYVTSAYRCLGVRQLRAEMTGLLDNAIDR